MLSFKKENSKKNMRTNFRAGEKIEDKKNEQSSMQILDAIMYLSGSNDVHIRGIAFSTLSTLSIYSSEHPSVMSQIVRDT